jgi:hypothetical protein
MTRSGKAARTTVTLVALVTALFSGVISGLHTSSDAVGQTSREPTRIYFSQHDAEDTEQHLHAVTGVDSQLCLACFLSLRQKTALEATPALFPLADSTERVSASVSPSPSDTAPRFASSRAPPSA